MDFLKKLKKEERVSLELGDIYGGCGYKKYKMSKFESYGMYLENKNFLQSESVITFNDGDGRLLALKPDVTLSIVKNAKGDRQNSEKLYYAESVYRKSRQSGEFREISQMGLEFIGEADGYSVYEIICLAAKSLAVIDENFILDISHMGLVTGLLSGLGIDEAAAIGYTELIKEKNIHDLKKRAESDGLSLSDAEKLVKLASLCGEFSRTLAAAEELAAGEEGKNAYAQLKELGENLQSSGFSDRVRLDFSIVNDISYYNGIVMRGYVEKMPKAVLAGGRYDKLLNKFGKDADAMGFAVYLDELSRYYADEERPDADYLLLYGAENTAGEIASAMDELNRKGFSARAEKSVPKEFRYGKIMDLRKGGNVDA